MNLGHFDHVDLDPGPGLKLKLIFVIESLNNGLRVLVRLLTINVHVLKGAIDRFYLSVDAENRRGPVLAQRLGFEVVSVPAQADHQVDVARVETILDLVVSLDNDFFARGFGRLNKRVNTRRVRLVVLGSDQNLKAKNLHLPAENFLIHRRHVELFVGELLILSRLLND